MKNIKTNIFLFAMIAVSPLAVNCAVTAKSAFCRLATCSDLFTAQWVRSTQVHCGSRQKT